MPTYETRLRARSTYLLVTLGLLTLSSFAAGCGRTPSPEDPSQIGAGLDLVSLLPPDAHGVMVMDVQAIRAAPFFATLDEAVEPHMTDESSQARELFGRVDRVAVAYRHGEDSSNGEPLLMLARGRFSAADLETLGNEHEAGTHRTHALRRDDGTALALVGDHTLAFGSEELVLAALDRMDGLVPATGPTSAVFRDAARRAGLGDHTVSFAAEVSESFRGELSDEFPMRGESISVGAAVDIGSALEVDAFGLFASDESASAIAEALRAKLAEASAEIASAGVGAEEYLEHVEIRADGPVVNVDLRLDSDAFDRLVQVVISGFQAFAAGAASSFEEEAPVEASSESDGVF